MQAQKFLSENYANNSIRYTLGMWTEETHPTTDQKESKITILVSSGQCYWIMLIWVWNVISMASKWHGQNGILWWNDDNRLDHYNQLNFNMQVCSRRVIKRWRSPQESPQMILKRLCRTTKTIQKIHSRSCGLQRVSLKMLFGHVIGH